MPTSIQFRGVDSAFASEVISDLDDGGTLIRSGETGEEALILVRVDSPVTGFVLVRRATGGRLAKSSGRPVHYKTPVIGASCEQLATLSRPEIIWAIAMIPE